MALRPKTIAWWDLETTGNKDDSAMIEIGIAVSDMKLNLLGTKSILNGSPVIDMRIFDVDSVVLDMHSKNGLWKDLYNATARSLESIDTEIWHWLRTINDGTEHIAFAGSGVGHFDRQYIKRDLPKTNKILTYWPLDIGVERRLTQLALPEIEDEKHKEYVDLKPHRALDDALIALYEARAWVNTQRELRNFEPWTFTDLPQLLAE